MTTPVPSGTPLPKPTPPTGFLPTGFLPADSPPTVTTGPTGPTVTTTTTGPTAVPPPPPPPPPGRRLAAELVGTALLAAVVVGSGRQADALTADAGLRFLADVGASAAALAVLITLFGPVSGGHLNPLITAGAWWTGRGDPAGLPLRAAVGYAAAQTVGAVAGTGLADAMFGHPAFRLSTVPRGSGALWLGEAVATGTLLLVVTGATAAGRGRSVPALVGLWVVAACWATSSGGFANPAVTLGRALTDGWTGIAPGSVPGFVLAQCAGAAAGLGLAALLFDGRERAHSGARQGVSDTP
ncbi:aquaporin [Kitasatospora purpeofusca]|uniref:aquaporin n=1 Tax=Kitasatospora purpeofusca TaxID=67352 RepID=UPI002A598343|nr:aquaporin [Kitasatospora purpeofusca]MDY0811735.1 aquaporin [Kitasatospora purpeofusca]